MTAAQFYRLALSLWGEKWRRELIALLLERGLSYRRQSLYNWQHGIHAVPLQVENALNAEKQQRKETAMLSKSLAGYYRGKKGLG